MIGTKVYVLLHETSGRLATSANGDLLAYMTKGEAIEGALRILGGSEWKVTGEPGRGALRVADLVIQPLDVAVDGEGPF